MPGSNPTPTKGQRTREEILRLALDLTSTVGLEGLTIGTLATKAGLSKSGLYAHFDSKESLQIAVLDAAVEQFNQIVLSPAFAEPRGLPRIERLFERWMKWEDEQHTGGCPLVAAATDFDDRPGPVHDRIAGYIDEMINISTRVADLAVEEGHFRADLDTREFAYECWGILLANMQFRRLLSAQDSVGLARRAFDGLIARALDPAYKR